MVQDNEIARMSLSEKPWWEREKMLSEKDREAIQRAVYADWTDIDESSAETEAGKNELHRIKMTKLHNEEFKAKIL